VERSKSMRFFRMLVMGIAVLGFMTMSAQAGTIDLIVNAYATAPDSSVVPILSKTGDAVLTPVPVGSVITYEIAVAVDDSAGSTAPGNLGMATVVFDVLNAGACSGYQMPYITAAESGYAEAGQNLVGPLRTTVDLQYQDSGTTAYPGYNGGWGFDNAGIPIGGNTTTSLCDVLGAGALAVPLGWLADVNPSYPGLQPKARLGVGIGTYMFGADDPSDANGKMGGFGQDLSNANNVIPGDGHWMMFRSQIDVSGWSSGQYGWDVVPTNGAVFSPTVDYNVDVTGGFRIAVFSDQMGGDSFSFFLVPEPASLGLLLIGGLALIRRRR